MPSLVRQIAKDLELLKLQGSANQQNQCDVLALTGQINKLISEQHVIKQTNAELQLQVDKVTAEKVSLEQEKIALMNKISKLQSGPKNPNNKVVMNPDKTLLIGSSILRNVESKNKEKLTIDCLRGGKQADVQQKIENLNIKYHRIIIAVGTNDCDDSKQSASIIEERRQLLEEARKHADHVVISSILPRKNGPLQLKIDAVNQSTKQLCTRYLNVEYVCNDESFKLANLNPNEAMFTRDCLHPSHRGTIEMLQNLSNWATTNSNNRPVYFNSNMWSRKNQEFSSSNYPRGRRSPAMPSCVWCRSDEHLASNCPSRGSRCCHNCGSTGHIARWCTF